MTSSMPQGSPMTIERLCRQARVSRAGYYRFWRASLRPGVGDAARGGGSATPTPNRPLDPNTHRDQVRQ